MARRLSMATRSELVEAIIERYRSSDRADKQRILDEFVAVTGYHRKHAIRVLCRPEKKPPAARQHATRPTSRACEHTNREEQGKSRVAGRVYHRSP